MKTHSVVFSDRATRSVDAHAEFLDRVSVSAAKRFLRGIYAESERLASLPLSNPAALDPELEAEGIRTRLYRQGTLSWSIYFRVEGSSVIVFDVCDSRALPPTVETLVLES